MKQEVFNCAACYFAGFEEIGGYYCNAPNCASEIEDAMLVPHDCPLREEPIIVYLAEENLDLPDYM